MTSTEFEKWLQDNRSTIRAIARQAAQAIPGMEIEDIEQELCLSCWHALGSYSPETSGFTCFARTVMQRRVCELIRFVHSRNRSGPPPPASLSAPLPNGMLPDEVYRVPGQRELEDTVCVREALRVFQTELGTCSPRTRDLIRWTLLGYPQARMAAQAGVSQARVSVSLRNFRWKLRKKLLPYGPL